MSNKKEIKQQLNSLQAHPLSRHSFLLLFIFICSCHQETPLFRLLPAQQTGITFQNKIIEDETHNILNFTNLYTGSGVGIGDFNQDGKPDIFLGGNMESSRLYINEGNFRFTDKTEMAGVKTDRWITGVSVVDINKDGWDDIYLCVSGHAVNEQRSNLLFVNNQDNSFTEQSANYGLDVSAQCTHASFFDYDKDGDLDVFIIVNPTNYKLYNVNNIRRKKINGEAASTDLLYENNGDGTFTDVSGASGILIEGYSLGLNVSDLNNDGWSDIYVTNDFLTNDILYINNQDGTFTNRAAESLKHTSFASMGVDVADINNDGLPEIYVLDMFPEDNYRQKMIMGSDNYDRFEYMLKTGYEPQYSRNTLQLNNGDGSFSEIGQLAEVHKTDWSWSALFADFDNDGWKDLYVTNGFRRDLGDLDYINYTNTNPFGDPASRKKNQLERIQQQPGAAIPNYIFKNENGWAFHKKSKAWGIDLPSYSHGAALADLDLDGDMDLVVNNVSQMAFIYENQANQLLSNHFVQLKLSDSDGAKVWIYYQEKMQFIESTLYRGYQSTVEDIIHFGLGNTEIIDSVVVVWSDDSQTVLHNLDIDQRYQVNKASVKKEEAENKREGLLAKNFIKVPNLLNYTHQEDLQVDFKAQSLLPHQHSRQGPAICTGDINNDGLDDVFIGGAATYPATYFIQKEDGTFLREIFLEDKEREDIDALLVDVDNDEDLDLYVVSGGVVYGKKKNIYQDRLYLNEQGKFYESVNSLPKMNTSGGCVRAADFDQDGDIDFFVGGRVQPLAYPGIPSSHLLENRQGKFVDILPEELSKLGMVSSAIWADVDNDQDFDLVIVGEFMPITIIENRSGILNFEGKQAIKQTSGWWNTIAAGDFDHDGDVDFLVGNLGLNSNLKASSAQPVCLYANDFDDNGSIDPILCQYLNDEEYPVVSRDKLIGQIPPIKNRFNTYKKYAQASFREVFKTPEKEGMQVLEACEFKSIYLENIGHKNFKQHALPLALQVAPINQFLVEDVNQDGYLDAIVVGNNYANEVGMGRYDAFTGAVMYGRGDGTFTVIKGADTGFLADKDARSIAKMNLKNGEQMYLIGNNADSLQVFKHLLPVIE